jgi:anti-sigma regulatory factor (Ser/Thr protein kinase)
MKDLSLHILDIVENSIEAGAQRIEVTVNEDTEKNSLVLEIEDDGKGMDKTTLSAALDPFFTTKKSKRVGLGLSLLAQSAQEAEGSFDVMSKKGKGTSIRAQFKHDHIDRKPLGNIVDTLIAIIATDAQNVDIVYRHRKNNKSFVFDSRAVKQSLNGIPINSTPILNYVRNNLIKEFKNIGVNV